MLDLSSDNQDGFEDTDGQLYTSISLFIFIREISTAYYERKRIDTRKGSEDFRSKHHWKQSGRR